MLKYFLLVGLLLEAGPELSFPEVGAADEVYPPLLCNCKAAIICAFYRSSSLYNQLLSRGGGA